MIPWVPNKTFDIEIPLIALAKSEYPPIIDSESKTKSQLILCEVFFIILFSQFHLTNL